MMQEQVGPPTRQPPQTLSWPAVLGWVALTMLTWQPTWAPLGGNELLSDWSTTGGMFDVEPYLLCESGLIGGAVIGALAGLGQWWLLRRLLLPNTPWRLCTILGYALAFSAAWSLGLLLLSTLRYHYGPPYTALPSGLVTSITVEVAAICTALVGLVLGFTQWVPLRARTPLAALWPLTTLLTWPLAAVVYWLLYLSLGGPVCQVIACEFDPPSAAYYTASALAWLAAGLLLGITTALTMRYLLAAPPSAAPRRGQP